MSLVVQKVKVLLLEDDEALSKSLIRLFEKNDLVVSPAFTVQQALELIEQQSFDLCVSDFNLTDQNALQFFRALRSHSSMKKIPIILHSGWTGLKEKDLTPFQPIRYLQKPVPMAELLKAINEALVI